MKTRTTIASLLMLSALSLTPAYANYFSNPATNTNLNIGSAPNPTPADVRASYFGPVAYDYTYERAYVVPETVAVVKTGQLTDLEGLPVFGARGQYLGHVLAVDQGARMIELQTPTGVGVAMPAALLTERMGQLMAPTTSTADVLAMARTQTGHTTVIDIG